MVNWCALSTFAPKPLWSAAMGADQEGDRKRLVRRVWLAAAVLFAAALAIRWPGVAMFDSISQYEQATSGAYNDWHPPIVARLWSLLLPIHRGTQPMLVLQMLAWWGGLGLIAAALARNGRGKAAAWVLAIGACPLWLGWATVILKDVQLAASLVLATGVVAHWRLAGRALPRWAVAAVAILILYASFTRGNSAFATVPLALGLWGWGGARRPTIKTGMMLAGVALIVGVSPLVNRTLLGAEDSGVARALPLYDITGIAVHAPLASLPGIAPFEWGEARQRDCYTPYFWNPYGEPTQCDWIGRKVAFDPGPGDHINRLWLTLLLAHPVAYAEHRLVHLNSNLRFIVGTREPDAVPPATSEKNEYGLGAPASEPAKWLLTGALWVVKTPLGWPVVWLVLSLGLVWAARDAESAQARLGRALAASAAVMSGSYALVSIASDLRYHLWSMVAGALALALLADARAVPRARLRLLVAPAVAVALVALVARYTAPRQHIPKAYPPTHAMTLLPG